MCSAHLARTAVLVFTTLLLPTRTATAVDPMPFAQNPPLTIYPCDSAQHPCNSCGQFTRDEALQVQLAQRSGRSTETPNQPYGICPGSHSWCKLTPTLKSPSSLFTHDASGNPVVQISVEYDLPNNYCLVWDQSDSCHASYWPVPEVYLSHLTRLRLYVGQTLIYNVPAVFENGVWMPTVAAPCDGSTVTYTIVVTNGGGFSECAAITTASVEIPITFPAPTSPFCRGDLRPCGGCDPATGGAQ